MYGVQNMKVLEILNKAEKELREAIAEAARSGDYRAVEVGRNVAVNIKEICERISGNGQIMSKPSSISNGTVEKSQKKREKVTSRSKPEGLPRFEVRNGSLYKIGWSKRQRSEYSHKVPRSSYNVIVNLMTKLANEGTGPFKAEAVIEKINVSDMIPTYQVYVVLAALRSLDAINQIGREGYDIPINIAEKARNIWRELSGK
jgi:hypothetical protein